MTPREMVIEQARRRRTDHLPCVLGFEGDFAVDTTGSSRFVTDPYGSRWRVDARPLRLVKAALKGPSLDQHRFPDLDRLFTPDIRKRCLRFARGMPIIS